MTAWLLPLLAGFGTGILSAWGVGGGTLLLLLMTLVLQLDPVTARAINLLYFLPVAGLSLLQHRKNGYLDKECFCAAAPWGAVTALLGAVLSLRLETEVLRRPFGVLLLLAAGSLLLRKGEGKAHPETKKS